MEYTSPGFRQPVPPLGLLDLPNCAEWPAVSGGDVERGQRSCPCCSMVNKGNRLCAGMKTRFLQGNTMLMCSKPRAGQARIGCQVNGEVSRQQQEPTVGLSESGRNLLRLRWGGCQRDDEPQLDVPHAEGQHSDRTVVAVLGSPRQRRRTH